LEPVYMRLYLSEDTLPFWCGLCSLLRKTDTRFCFLHREKTVEDAVSAPQELHSRFYGAHVVWEHHRGVGLLERSFKGGEYFAGIGKI